MSFSGSNELELPNPGRAFVAPGSPFAGPLKQIIHRVRLPKILWRKAAKKRNAPNAARGAPSVDLRYGENFKAGRDYAGKIPGDALGGAKCGAGFGGAPMRTLAQELPVWCAAPLKNGARGGPEWLKRARAARKGAWGRAAKRRDQPPERRSWRL